MRQYNRSLVALVLGVILGLGISAEARKPCSVKSCKGSIKARCVGLKGKAKRRCKRGIISSCRAGQCSCTGGVPSCAEPPTTTSTSTTSTTTTSTSTTSTTLMSGACLRDTGDGTIQDICTGLQWEKKVNDPGLQNVATLYSWAGCCDGDCSTIANLCQPNAAAAATCAANADGGAEGCSTCVSGTCNVDPDLSGVPTTVWDWINQLNAASFAGHNDWRLPSEDGNNLPSGAKELETIVDMAATGCGFGSPCIDPIFGATVADAYFSATTISNIGDMGSAWSVDFSAGNVGSGFKQDGFYVRAVR